jgi:hypothetical protein
MYAASSFDSRAAYESAVMEGLRTPKLEQRLSIKLPFADASSEEKPLNESAQEKKQHRVRSYFASRKKTGVHGEDDGRDERWLAAVCTYLMREYTRSKICCSSMHQTSLSASSNVRPASP